MQHGRVSVLSIASLVLMLFTVMMLGCGEEQPLSSEPRALSADSQGKESTRTLQEWVAERKVHERTTWADEMLAQEYERTIVSLWDALLSADRRESNSGKVEALASIDFKRLEIGKPVSVENLPHDIERFEFGMAAASLTHREWHDWLKARSREGYVLVQSEWHHAQFFPPSGNRKARSAIKVVLHVLQEPENRRIILEGNLAIEWSYERDARGLPVPESIDATGLQMLTRTGPTPFVEILTYERQRTSGRSRLHPLLLYDLNKDGYSEVVMPGAGRVLWNRGNGSFEEAPIAGHPVLMSETAVVSDITGDSYPDLLASDMHGNLVLYPGDKRGRFSAKPIKLQIFDHPLRAPSALTVGDVDADGDLDVWLAQYKPAYAEGQMPTPYYDANDGHPAYLLLNDGKGGLRDATEEAGLMEKRHRRTYATSLVDLDDDSDLDLLVVSDFSGIDIYHNNGSGEFVDANETLLGGRHLFGMSSSFADFDLDGRLDFFAAGMASTTARRLESLGLGREDLPEMQKMRMEMAFGNRMYLSGKDGWREPDFAGDVARTGWAWGTTAFDFDNDGAPDLFTANGNESGESTKDYCVNFWTNDIFAGTSEPNEALNSLFVEKTAGLAAGKESWDGYQKNQLLMNREGKGFVNIAFLMGVADEFDSRSAVSDDVDRDGRVDLLVVENHGAEGEILHVYRNQVETENHWIGVDLQEEGHGRSPVGVRVTVRTMERVHVGRVITGETLMGQHATTLHFGLGRSEKVESIEVVWIDGTTRVIQSPEIDRYHLVLASQTET